MKSKSTTVAQLAAEAGIEVDETLIALWDAGFDAIVGPRDVLRPKESTRARRALGLATRRELASPEYWERELSLSRADLDGLLAGLGVARPYDGTRLRAKAIQRLTSERRRQAAAVPSELLVECGELTGSVEKPLAWTTIGHVRALSYLSVKDVLDVHEALVTDFANTSDPLDPPGVRSESLLESAVNRPRTGIGEQLKYPTAEMAAAALLHGLVHDHPFHNGNKRTALVAMLVFLDENGMLLTCDEDGLFKLVLQLAQHAVAKGPRHEMSDREVMAISQWIRGHGRLMEKGDRPLSWRRLKRILVDHGCTLSNPIAGNRINIERVVQVRRRWPSRSREIALKTQTHYGDDGREVDKTAINRMRHELHLDDEHGTDSAAFYENAPTTASEFIVRYRKTLRRLARL